MQHRRRRLALRPDTHSQHPATAAQHAMLAEGDALFVEEEYGAAVDKYSEVREAPPLRRPHHSPPPALPTHTPTHRPHFNTARRGGRRCGATPATAARCCTAPSRTASWGGSRVSRSPQPPQPREAEPHRRWACCVRRQTPWRTQTRRCGSMAAVPRRTIDEGAISPSLCATATTHAHTTSRCRPQPNPVARAQGRLLPAGRLRRCQRLAHRGGAASTHADDKNVDAKGQRRAGR